MRRGWGEGRGGRGGRMIWRGRWSERGSGFGCCGEVRKECDERRWGRKKDLSKDDDHEKLLNENNKIRSQH